MSDFAGTEYDFAAGSLKGLRGWNMDHLGRLHGVTHQEVWRPGENVSVCKQATKVPCPQVNHRDEARRASEAGRAQVESKKRRKKRESELTFIPDETWHFTFTVRQPCADPTCVGGEYHAAPSDHRFDPECQCGFWAYDEDGFTPQGSVIGVIEGYGKTTVGTKGFRAEKARIVALCCEDGEGDRLSRSTLTRLATLYPDVSFHDDLDAMVDAHPEVMRTWAEVDAGFWLRPVPEKRNAFYGPIGSLYRTFANSGYGGGSGGSL